MRNFHINIYSKIIVLINILENGPTILKKHKLGQEAQLGCLGSQEIKTICLLWSSSILFPKQPPKSYSIKHILLMP